MLSCQDKESKEMALSESQRRVRKSKQSERDLGHFLLQHDGPDPAYRLISSSTGRVGHISDLQFDVVSRSYAAENKNVKVPLKLLRWWEQIGRIAHEHGKCPMLRIVPSNEGKYQEMHIITADRHKELLQTENRLRDLQK